MGIQRRQFIQKLGTGIVSTAFVPALVKSTNGSSFPDLPIASTDPDESYWELVKAQFATPDDLIMANAANLCPSPYVVQERVQHFANSLEQDVSFQNRNQFGEIRKKTIELMAEYLGASGDEIALVRNTSEGNCIVINGLDFKSGDEVVIWDQNHPSNNVAWKQSASRHGFKVVECEVPKQPKTADEIFEAFIQKITSNTRLMAFSHISNVSGIAVPAKEICRMARERGILTLIDGAQAFGFLDLDIHDLGCDFYTGSCHKWLMGPRENGVLFVKRDHLNRIYASVIAAGWSEDFSTIDEKLAVLGQRNDATIAAVCEIIDFHNTIGKPNVEKRIRHINQHLKSRIKELIPSVEFVTPWDSDLSGCIVISSFPGKDHRQLFQRMYDEHGIACAPTGGVRLSPNIYNTMSDVEKMASALAEVVSP